MRLRVSASRPVSASPRPSPRLPVRLRVSPVHRKPADRVRGEVQPDCGAVAFINSIRLVVIQGRRPPRLSRVAVRDLHILLVKCLPTAFILEATSM